jgi:hypothetical protein
MAAAWRRPKKMKISENGVSYESGINGQKSQRRNNRSENQQRKRGMKNEKQQWKMKNQSNRANRAEQRPASSAGDKRGGKQWRHGDKRDRAPAARCAAGMYGIGDVIYRRTYRGSV